MSPFLAQDADHFAITTRAALDGLQTPLPAGAGVLAEIPFLRDQTRRLCCWVERLGASRP